MHSTLTFLRALFAAPGQVGALLPSSAYLAQAMAQQALACDRHGTVLEIGAGSGALTRSLLASFGTARLQVLECSPPLVQVLSRRFPQLHILRDRAEHVLHSARFDPASTLLVSSLPFKSLPRAQAKLLAQVYLDFVFQGACILQFSYGIRPPFVLPPSCGLQWKKQCKVWRNLPPAIIWQLEAPAHLHTTPSYANQKAPESPPDSR